MEDKDLLDIWKQGSEHEKALFIKNQGDYSQLAQQQSNNIFEKIRRNIIHESIASAISVPLILVFLWSEPVLFWITIVMMVIACIPSYNIYFKYMRDIKQINESSIEESLRKKLLILSRYIQKMKFYLIISAVLGFAIGFSFHFTKKEEIDWLRTLYLAGIASLFLGLFIWLTKKYIYEFYTKRLESIEEIYHRLIENK